MKKMIKKIGCLVIVFAMLLIQSIPVGAEDTQTRYVANFVNEHATIDVYYTQDYTAPSEESVVSAIARNSETGEIDITGDGQINFKVNVEEGYKIKSVKADANFKNLKVQGNNIYRLTKITGNVTVTIEVEKASLNEESSQETDTNEESSQESNSVNKSDIVINEIESNGDVTDWVEIYNKGTQPVDISGWYITDDKTTRKADGKVVTLKKGTILNPGQYYVFEEKNEFDFGLGAPDEVNLFDSTDSLVEKISWSTHASGTLARVPDGNGAMIEVSISTKGATNNNTETEKPKFDGAIEWPGSDKVITYDEGKSIFQSDSSGLDFYKGKLYCINNKKGTFWVMNVDKKGTIDYADGFTSSGKNLSFKHDESNASASNPDAEGITIDSNGLAYAAVERDNNNNKVNANWILQFDPWADGPTVVASAEWNITALLPDVPANAGIEAAEWVSNEFVAGKLFDDNTGAPFNPENYPKATANGVFFVALEKNGHVYAFVLNNDGSAQRIADIDPGIGGAMALDFDTYENTLWVAADDGYDNMSAKINFNGTNTPKVTLVKPAAGIDIARNNEGFAIADPEYTIEGLRPVYHFMDGATSGVLTISYINNVCDHSWGEWKITSKATCKNSGTKTCECKICGEVKTADYTDKDNHVGGTYVKNKVFATSIKDGYTGDICCIDCDKVLKTGDLIPKVTQPVELTKQDIDDSVNKIIEAAQGSDKKNKEVVITMVDDNKVATVIPKKILETARGKNVDVKFDMNVEEKNGYSWTINGKNIKNISDKEINLEVIVGVDVASNKVLKDITKGNKESLQISLIHDGEFGFEATLTLNVGKEKKDQYVNLYWYKEDGIAELIEAAKVDKSGFVELDFNHASDYIIVYDSVDRTAVNQEAKQNTSKSETTPYKTSSKTEVRPATAPKTDDADVTLYITVLACGLGMLVILKKINVINCK